MQLVTELENIAKKSVSVPAQLCGEAAKVIRGMLDHNELIKENLSLKSQVEDLQRELSLRPIPGTLGSYTTIAAAQMSRRDNTGGIYRRYRGDSITARAFIVG